jgi:opacity protein-like surface antigen
MKRTIIAFCLLLLLAILVQAADKAKDSRSFTLAIKGGWGHANIGDLNAYYKTHCADEVFNIPENEGNRIPQLGSSFADLEIEGEFFLDRHFSLGLALGFPIRKSDKAVWYVNFNGSLQPVVLKPKVITYIPIKLNIYYHLPLSSKVQLLIGGGPGIYPTEIRTFDVSSHFPLGLQVVSGLEINLTQKLSLIVDGEWRLAKITNFKGDDYSGNEATLWYYKMRYFDSDIWWDELIVSKSAPEEDPLGEKFYKDQRKARYDLSGFSIRLGLKFAL